MKQIKFRPEFITLIRGGQKTQTRRPVGKQEYRVGETLRITGTCDYVRIAHKHIEQLHDITEAGAQAEGMQRGAYGVGYIPAAMAEPYVYAFSRCWDHIYGPGARAAGTTSRDWRRDDPLA